MRLLLLTDSQARERFPDDYADACEGFDVGAGHLSSGALRTLADLEDVLGGQAILYVCRDSDGILVAHVDFPYVHGSMSHKDAMEGVSRLGLSELLCIAENGRLGDARDTPIYYHPSVMVMMRDQIDGWWPR